MEVGAGPGDSIGINRKAEKSRCVYSADFVTLLFMIQYTGHVVIKPGTIIFGRDAWGSGKPEDNIILGMTFLQ